VNRGSVRGDHIDLITPRFEAHFESPANIEQFANCTRTRAMKQRRKQRLRSYNLERGLASLLSFSFLKWLESLSFRPRYEDVSSTSIARGIAIKAGKKRIKCFEENCWRSQQDQCACSFTLVELEYIIHKTSAVVPTTEPTQKGREEIQTRAAA